MSKETPTWHMRRALRLAKKANGWTLPNPMVGAVIVKNGVRIGEGYHEKFGTDHAEIAALKDCSSSAKGATLFVTLEPCCHTDKTPPCTKAIIESGINKVIIAAKDPSKKINGKGVKELEKAGIEVEVGLLEKQAEELNKGFFTFHQKKRPFVTLKVGMSLDGKVAQAKGVRTQITGERSQKNLHLLRHNHQAIMVGSGTVLTDDPHLGVRDIEGRDPLRIILEGKNKLPDNLQVFRDENYLLIKKKSINEILENLYDKGIVSILVEGGPTVFTEFLKSRKFDEMKFFIAPKILGEDALAFTNLKESLPLQTQSVRKLGQDILITTTPQWDSNNG